jgi:hypothetical protein
VRIDPEFDHALSTADGLVLTYADADARERAMGRHGQLLGELVDAHIVLLVPMGPRTRLLSLQPRAELGTLSGDSIPAEMVRAITASMGLVNSQPSAAAAPTLQIVQEAVNDENSPNTPPPSSDIFTRVPALRDESGISPAQLAAGIALAAVGVGSLATAWVFYAQRAEARARSTWSLSYADRDDYQSAGSTALWLAAGGGVLISSAEYLLLPRERGIPTSAWAWGGAGVLLAASGVALLVAESDCTLPSPHCRGFGSDVAFGPMLMLHSVPLLAVPLNYALHEWLRPTRRIELGLGGPHLSLKYRF